MAVTNSAEWQSLLSSPTNPLRNVPSEAVKAFTDSLIFKKGGFAHASYTSLVPHLKRSEIIALFTTHFGMTPEEFASRDNFKCDSPGTCKQEANSVCTDNC